MTGVRKRFIIMIILAVTASGCKTNSSSATDGSNMLMAPPYMPISDVACRDSVGIDGQWRLVNIHQDERNYTPAKSEMLIIKNCSEVSYITDGKFERKESFKLLRVLNYCADYQLNYIGKNDSISCINMRKDTLIFGDCSTFETTRYFYKKM